MCSWQAERGTGRPRLQWNDFCYSRRNKCEQNAKLLISHYFWCLMLEFARVLGCCSFHSCDLQPSTSLQLRGVRVQSISLKSGSAISIIDVLTALYHLISWNWSLLKKTRAVVNYDQIAAYKRRKQTTNLVTEPFLYVVLCSGTGYRSAWKR